MDHNPNCSSNETFHEGCRPWEVAVIGLCASQHPIFKDVVRGPSGIPSLVLALNDLLATDIGGRDSLLNTTSDIFIAISRLSHCEWVKDIANPAFISLMVDVLRCEIFSQLYGFLIGPTTTHYIFQRMLPLTDRACSKT